MVISLSFLNHIARINSAQRQTRSLILKVFVCMGMGGGSLLKNSLTAIKKKTHLQNNTKNDAMVVKGV